MKKAIPFVLILTIIMSGCGSSKKQLEKGNYDAAIDKSVKQLRKDRKDSKQIEILQSAYKIANDQDNERVRFLKMRFIWYIKDYLTGRRLYVLLHL